MKKKVVKLLKVDGSSRLFSVHKELFICPDAVKEGCHFCDHCRAHKWNRNCYRLDGYIVDDGVREWFQSLKPEICSKCVKI